MLIQALYFFLPAYVANMVPIIFSTATVSGMFSRPIDAYRSFHGVRIFGDSKTWGGLIGGILCGTLTFIIQKALYHFHIFRTLSLVDYSIQPLTLGLSMAAGALCGDLVKSFVKRRMKKAPGTAWFPFDQIDYVLGAFLFILPFYTPSIVIFLFLLLVAPIIHYAANYLAFVFGLKKVWW